MNDEVVRREFLIRSMVTLGGPSVVGTGMGAAASSLLARDGAPPNFADCVGRSAVDRKVLDVFVQQGKWACFDAERGYIPGNHSPAGNHFFAHSINNDIVKWLVPKPIT